MAMPKFNSSILNGLRAFLLAQIYPAPRIFNRGTRNFIGLQQMLRLIPEYATMCQHKIFDVHGNCYAFPKNDIIENGQFEAVIICEDQDIYKPNKNYIIHIGGNNTCCQIFVPEMLSTYQKFHKQICLIAFNPPGVGLSPGNLSDLDEYCAALRSIVANLQQNKIPGSHIMIIGHSLGAAIAARVVAEYHEKGINLKLFADRTMSSISNAVAARVLSILPNFLKYILGNLLRYLIKTLVRYLQLELDVATDIALINSRNPGAAKGMTAHDDEMMQGCCVSAEIPPRHLAFFPRFRLKDEDVHRKSHSKPRDALVPSDKEISAANAQEHLHTSIRHSFSTLQLPG
jgi:pimeloyl-ACP methyl ester carboxylesterase